MLLRLRPAVHLSTGSPSLTAGNLPLEIRAYSCPYRHPSASPAGWSSCCLQGSPHASYCNPEARNSQQCTRQRPAEVGKQIAGATVTLKHCSRTRLICTCSRHRAMAARVAHLGTRSPTHHKVVLGVCPDKVELHDRLPESSVNVDWDAITVCRAPVLRFEPLRQRMATA